MLTTLTNLKVYLGITDNSQDALLNLLLAGSSEQIEAYCCRKFEAANYTETTDGLGTSSLFLKNYPVNTFTSLSINTGTSSTPVWDVVDADSYQVETDLGEIRALSQFSRGLKIYKAIYNGGYATVPMDLQLATCKLTAAYYNSRSSD